MVSVAHVFNNNHLKTFQYAFMACRSNQTTLGKLTNDLLLTTNLDSISVTVILDFSATFDNNYTYLV